MINRVTPQQVDDLLPQTQCTQCGYNGCMPYAEAISTGLADINRCPPGGTETISSLATLLGVEAKPLDAECGTHIPRHIADIHPEHCIGCTLCIKACPVDAIVGANKKRHAVIASLCTGCELCIAPCPVDCIDMVLLPGFSEWGKSQADQARVRLHKREVRLVRQREETDARLESKALKKLSNLEAKTEDSEIDKKRAIIEAALKRARARRSSE